MPSGFPSAPRPTTTPTTPASRRSSGSTFAPQGERTPDAASSANRDGLGAARVRWGARREVPPPAVGGVAMDRLSPLDASFLHLEDDVNHMHIGSASIFEGPPPGYDEFTGTVAGRLAPVPRYRQKVAMVPLSLGRPVWVDDPHFNIEYHVRHTALPEPGGDAELGRLVGRVMSQRLDRSKPLWEIWMVDGLGDGRWAMVSKVHHCLVDGVSGAELLAVLLDVSPEVPAPVSDGWHGAGAPSPIPLARDPVGDPATRPDDQPQGADRAPSPLLLDGGRPGRHQADPDRPRRHRERRGPRAHHPWLP